MRSRRPTLHRPSPRGPIFNCRRVATPPIPRCPGGNGITSSPARTSAVRRWSARRLSPPAYRGRSWNGTLRAPASARGRRAQAIAVVGWRHGAPRKVRGRERAARGSTKEGPAKKEAGSNGCGCATTPARIRTRRACSAAIRRSRPRCSGSRRPTARCMPGWAFCLAPETCRRRTPPPGARRRSRSISARATPSSTASGERARSSRCRSRRGSADSINTMTRKGRAPTGRPSTPRSCPAER